MSDEKSASELMQEGLAEIEASEEVVVEEEQEEEVSEPNPVEEKARKMGWRPKSELGEDFDESKFIEAGEFMRRQELFDKIGHEVKARQKLEAELKNVTSYVKKLTESEFNRQLQQLKAERQLALEEQDTEAADAVNEKIVDLKAAQAQQKEETVEEQQEEIKAKNQEMLGDWVVKNPWFNTDMELRELADDFAEQFAIKNPNESLDKLLDYVDKKVSKFIKKEATSKQEEVDDKEDDIKEAKAVPMSKVATSKTTTSRANVKAKSKVSRANLDTTQKHMLDTWILPNKIMTEEEYISSLVAMGEVAAEQ